jgi:hypothetical protein
MGADMTALVACPTEPIRAPREAIRAARRHTLDLPGITA